MKKLIFIIFSWLPVLCNSQGYNSAWLLGYYPYAYQKARINFDTSSYNLSFEYRKMTFYDTEGTICDASGNFLMSSNGVWVANANNDTMLNGSGLNPGPETSAYPNGLLLTYANIFLSYPDDTSKIALIHHTADANGISYSVFNILMTVIDMSLDSGLGGVISKNNIIFSDTLNQGIAACKHANGRDWWIVVQQHNTDTIFKLLLTPNGIESISSQKLNVPSAWFNVTQLTFSNDGSKFIYSTYDKTTFDESLLLFDFDRCSGMFSNSQIIPLTIGTYLWGLAFSPSSKFVYACTSQNIFQIKIDSLTIDTVASFDGFVSPFAPFYTTFFNMYQAANGKIYLTSGNSTSYLHFINYPDSEGIACDVHQHGVYLDSVRHFRSVPNHPNYYLGPIIGSTCDSLPHVGINEINNHDFHFSLSPNPVTDGYMKIMYLLPQNKAGWFEVYDVNGRKVFKMPLPPWSTLQQFKLPKLSSGIYNAVIRSGGYRMGKRVAVME